MADDPDFALVKQAQAELPYVTNAFEQLMQRYQALIFSVCLRMLGNRADADDISQDVMIKAFGSLTSFEGRSTFKTWLMRITTNTCITLQSKRRRQREMTTMLQGEPDSGETSQLDTAEYDVQRLLERVSSTDRQLLTLRFIAELKFDEIAEIAGLSLSATKMRIYRATEQLRAGIQAERGESEDNGA